MCVHKLIWYTCVCEIMQLRVCHVLLLIRINLQRSVVFECFVLCSWFVTGAAFLCVWRVCSLHRKVVLICNAV